MTEPIPVEGVQTPSSGVDWDALEQAAQHAVERSGWAESTAPAAVTVAVEGVMEYLRDRQLCSGDIHLRHLIDWHRSHARMLQWTITHAGKVLNAVREGRERPTWQAVGPYSASGAAWQDATRDALLDLRKSMDLLVEWRGKLEELEFTGPSAAPSATTDQVGSYMDDPIQTAGHVWQEELDNERVSVSPITDDMVTKGAAAISDLLTMLGVDPDERPEHGGPTTAETLAAAVLRASEEVSRG